MPEAIAEVARRRRTTYVLMGRSRPARGLARLRTPLPQRLMELLPGVDVRIVADRSRRANRRSSNDASGAVIVVIVVAIVGLGGRRRRLLAATRTGGAGGASTRCRAAHPAAVHRPGDFAACVRGRGPPRQGRERDDHAGVPRAGAEEHADRFAAARAVRGGDARARGDRADARPRRASPSTRASPAGRTYRDALRRLLEEEQFDRIIVSATDSPRIGLSGDDLQWLLERVPAEIMILRPAPDDTRRISAANGLHGHF